MSVAKDRSRDALVDILIVVALGAAREVDELLGAKLAPEQLSAVQRIISRAMQDAVFLNSDIPGLPGAILAHLKAADVTQPQSPEQGEKH